MTVATGGIGMRTTMCIVAVVATALAADLTMSTDTAMAAPVAVWNVESEAFPSTFQTTDGMENDSYHLELEYLGGAPASGSVTVEDRLPAGVTTSDIPPHDAALDHNGGEQWTCSSGAGQSVVTCTFGGLIASATATYNFESPSHSASNIDAISIPVVVAPGASGEVVNEVVASEAGVTVGESRDANPVNMAAAGFGPAFVNFRPVGLDGAPSAAAGAHPYAVTTDFQMRQEIAPGATGAAKENGYRSVVTGDEARTVVADVPLGLIGNPQAVPRCTMEEFHEGPAGGGLSSPGDNLNNCPADTRVGVMFGDRPAFVGPYQVFNLAPEEGHAAEFGVSIASFSIVLYGDVIPSPNGYMLRIAALIPQANLQAASVTFFGNPAEAFSTGLRETAFLTDPANCHSTEAERTLSLHIDSWAHPGVGSPFNPVFSDSNWAPAAAALAPIEGCGALTFKPTLSLLPSSSVEGVTTRADSQSAFDVRLSVPQTEVAGELATPQLRTAIVSLPEGVTVSPSAADGLLACTDAEIALESSAPSSCPPASQIGTARVTTPLLEEPLEGQVFVGMPRCSPCGNADAGAGRLLRLFIQLRSPARGVDIKLAGTVAADPSTGRLTATFADNPQLPFSELSLDVKGGPRAPLSTPQTCGEYTTTASLEPWSAPETPTASSESSFAVTSGANTGACPATVAQETNAPAFEAGTVDPDAAVYSPFVLKVSREDGSQRIKALNVTLPPGLTGKLAGVQECSGAAISAAEAMSGRAEQASSSCPLASELGTVNVGAGPGSNPFHVQGHAYLAGPYKGAPLSMVIITPAVAGPFDLGTVVVRAALFVDPYSAQITVRSDPIPQIRAGIPLDVRSIAVNISRNQFTLNPTSCNPMTLAASVVGSASEAAVSNPFQVLGCNSLGFRPKLAISLKGETRRTGHPALKAVVTYPEGGAYADIARAQVSLPGSEFLDQGNLNKVCTQPELNAGACPARSIYGHAKAWSPLLEKPLEGNVYLAVGFGYKLPALVAELDGQIRVLLKGKVDSDKAKGIRNTFEAVPDAPVSRFVLEMKGGKTYGLLENSEDICSKPQKANATFTAQNGKVLTQRPKIADSCGKKMYSKHRTRHHPTHDHREP